MSSEFPPIIIDGTNLIRTGDTQVSVSSGCVIARSADFGTRDRTGAIHIRPSLVSLYLIHDNQLLHQGDYKSEQIELVWGEGPDEKLPLGGESMTLMGTPLESQRGGLASIIAEGSKQVKWIRVPGESEPLQYGVDFHNFIVIVQRKRQG